MQPEDQGPVDLFLVNMYDLINPNADIQIFRISSIKQSIKYIKHPVSVNG